MSRWTALLAALCLTMGASCKQAEETRSKEPVSSPESSKPSAPDATTASANSPAGEPTETQVTVATFNAGLARNYVPFVDERLPAIIEDLNKLDADVLCLQEVWETSDVKAIVKGVKSSFPFNLRLDSSNSIHARTSGAPSCGSEDLKGLTVCVNENCATASDKTGCVMKKCGTHFLGLPSGCRTCLAANVSKPLTQIVSTCTSKGVSLGYDGANGLILLSRTKFEEVNNTSLGSFLMQRAILHGRVTVEGRDMNVFCTHLSTPVSEVEYGGKYESWKAEQLAQVKRAIEFVKEHAGSQPAILLGDLNLGPANTEWDVEAEFSDHFQLLLDAGFRSPYTESHGQCTFCAIEALGAEGSGRILDHALFLGLAEALFLPERILERNIEVGDRMKVPLSDHYGVRVEMEMR